jgi:hypothetical protein
MANDDDDDDDDGTKGGRGVGGRAATPGRARIARAVVSVAWVPLPLGAAATDGGPSPRRRRLRRRRRRGRDRTGPHETDGHGRSIDRSTDDDGCDARAPGDEGRRGRFGSIRDHHHRRPPGTGAGGRE